MELAIVFLALGLVTLVAWLGVAAMTDLVRLEVFLAVTVFAIVVLGGLLARPAETGSTTAHATALTTFARLGYTLKGEVVCTEGTLLGVSTGWRCSAAVEPEGFLVTLRCDSAQCLAVTP